MIFKLIWLLTSSASGSAVKDIISVIVKSYEVFLILPRREEGWTKEHKDSVSSAHQFHFKWGWSEEIWVWTELS